MIKKLSLLLCLVMILTQVGCTKDTEVSSNPSSAESNSSENVSSEDIEDTDTSAEVSYSDITVSTPSSNTVSSQEESKTEHRETSSVPLETYPSSSEVSSSKNTESFIPSISYATPEDATKIARLIAENINGYRDSSGVPKAVILSGLTGYAEYRSRQLVSNFAHDTKDEREAATALKYGQYVEPELYGMTGEPYYTANCGEAIAKADFAGTVENIADSFARLAKNSHEHWNYVGSEQYRFIAVGVTYNNGKWYCCIAVAINNSDEQ